MSDPPEHPKLSLVESERASEPDIFKTLQDLRYRFTTAWLERGVMLSLEERKRLHHEIKHTCEYLTLITQSGI